MSKCGRNYSTFEWQLDKRLVILHWFTQNFVFFKIKWSKSAFFGINCDGMKTFDSLKKPNLLVKTVLLLGRNRFGKNILSFQK